MIIQSIEDGRKEDGNRSIADKIIQRLHDLEKTVENNKGRWAWELLQNAKDSIADSKDGKVAIQIELDNDKVEFRHNGEYFTEKDIRGLINQISSKEVEEDGVAKKTGKFGTGFLTTHLLSKIIYIKGIVKTEKQEFYQFEFPLDRDGKTTDQLVPKIEQAWEKFHSSAEKISSKYDKAAFNTSFCYPLETKKQKDIAQIGIEEFTKLVPYVLTFLPSIESIEIINNNNDLSAVKFSNNQELLDDLIVPITRKEDKNESNIFILHVASDKVSIAIEVKKSDDKFYIKNINDIPKLFCDFPLIGTEEFHFPVVINSFFLNPQTERDGIWLKGDTDKEVLENKSLLIESVELYKKMIDTISEKNYHGFYNTTITKLPSTDEKYFDEKWYKEKIQLPLRNFILQSQIVELEGRKERKSIKDLWFPPKSDSKEVQQKIWQYTFDLFPESVCKKDHLHNWCDVSWSDGWNKKDYSQLIKDVSDKKNIDELSTSLVKNEKDTFDWLNGFCAFFLEDETNLHTFERSAVIPNQNKNFKTKSELYIDKIKDKILICILELLGDDWKNILLNDSVDFGRYQVKEKKHISIEITERLKKPSYNKDSIDAISLLSEWFENNQEEARELFSELYRKKAELFMNTIKDKESLYKVMRSKTNLAELSKVAQALENNPQLIEDIKKAEDLTNLLIEFNATDISELKQMLKGSLNGNNLVPKIEITQEVLASLGVKSATELEEMLKDSDSASEFIHTSTPNVEMFLFAEKLITRAKRRIIDHIQALDEYDCDEMDEVSTTVIRGIKKDGVELSVVVRPSDYGKVIIYHGAEKDILDYEYAELWIDNGSETPKHLTLGRILKNTGINKIPV